MSDQTIEPAAIDELVDPAASPELAEDLPDEPLPDTSEEEAPAEPAVDEPEASTTPPDAPAAADGDATLLEARELVRTGRIEMRERSAELSWETSRDLAATLAGKVRELNEVEEEQKSKNAGYNARRKALRLKIDTVSFNLERGLEPIDVRCEWWADHVNGQMELRQCFDGIVIERRAMTPEERQLAMDLDDDRHPADVEGMSDADAAALADREEGQASPTAVDYTLSASEETFDNFLLALRFNIGTITHVTVHPNFLHAMKAILRSTRPDGIERPQYWPSMEALEAKRLFGKNLVVDPLLAGTPYQFVFGSAAGRPGSDDDDYADVDTDDEEEEVDESTSEDDEDDADPTLSEDEKEELLQRARDGEWAESTMDAGQVPAADGEGV